MNATKKNATKEKLWAWENWALAAGLGYIRNKSIIAQARRYHANGKTPQVYLAEVWRQ